MKKALLIGAVVSSMALSSVSFAAVDYQNATTWTKDTDFAYNIETGVLTLVGDKTNANATTDTTIVVVNGENPTDITKDNIMYIDQAASAATYGNMGLLLPEPIAEGAKATVLFNDGTAAIYTATFDLAETVVTPPAFEGKTFVFGDVDGSYDETEGAAAAVDAVDAGAILALKAGGNAAVGGTYAIGTLVRDADGTVFVFGDVDGSYDEAEGAAAAVDAVDAGAILALKAGGNAEVGGAYAIGALVEAAEVK